MPAPVLIAYATRYGATKEAADAVGAVLRDHGLDVEIQPMRAVKRIQPYRAVVIGTALYMGGWYKDTDRLLTKWHTCLSQRPVAVFALGPIGAMPREEEFKGARQQLAARLAKHSWLAPAATAIFGGKYDPASLRFPDGLISALPASPLHGIAGSDVRDWVAIRAWAAELATRLQPA